MFGQPGAGGNAPGWRISGSVRRGQGVVGKEGVKNQNQERARLGGRATGVGRTVAGAEAKSIGLKEARNRRGWTVSSPCDQNELTADTGCRFGSQSNRGERSSTLDITSRHRNASLYAGSQS